MKRLLAAVAALLIVPATASATTVEVTADALVVTALPGEDNSMTVEADKDETGRVIGNNTIWSASSARR